MSTSEFKPVTHVIFDMDGTLIVDTERIHKYSFIRVANKYDREFTDDLRVKILGMQKFESATLIVKTLQLDTTPEEFLEEVYATEEKEFASVKFMHGVKMLLEHLSSNNVPMAVATSSTEKSYRMKTEHLREQFSVFNHVVTSPSDPEVKNGKPAPDIFNVCASRFPMKPLNSECLVFEDSPNGVTAALAAGMQVVMVPDMILPTKMTKSATLVLNSIEDFCPEIFELPSYDYIFAY